MIESVSILLLCVCFLVVILDLRDIKDDIKKLLDKEK